MSVPAWVRRSTLVALARGANALFFLLTSSYCLLTYSSFAYQQFIKPHLVNWLTGFVVWHHLGFWLALLVTAWTLLPDLQRERGAVRVLAWGYVAASALVGVVLLVRPVLPQVENNGRGLALALAALVPPIWLALVDHHGRFQPRPSSESRMLGAALLAGAVVWACQIVVIPWRLGQTGEITLTRAGIAFGVLNSAIGHALVFGVLGVLAIAILRLGARIGSKGSAEYYGLLAAAAVALTLVTNRLVFASIAFFGAAAWALSVMFGVLVASVWSGVARIVQRDRAGSEASALEWLLSPLPGAERRGVSVAVLAALVAIEAGAIAYLLTFDWDFLLQKLAVLAIWFLAFGYGYGTLSSGGRALGWRSVAAPVALPILLIGGSEAVEARLPGWLRDPGFVPEFALEGYVAVDPSYRIIHDALKIPSLEQAEYFAHLRAHSLIQHVTVAPIDIDFVSPLTPSTGYRPHIFLFVIDSLRRDYLSPYNPAVRFTPAIGRFAEDSVVFDRAFTRYGGTGLAVPAIWTGGMLLHKQYVTPYNPMNTLLKLINADGYRRLMSMDSIVVQLMPPPPEGDELDAKLPVVEYRLCRTLGDLETKLSTGSRDGRPIFAYTLPQDIHISHVRSEPVPPGASYPGFFPPAAAQIERMDACFGRFVDFLKTSGLYEDSVIAITSDHGDSLGESLRWGHSYTMFAEVARIPLIVRVPARVRERFAADPGAVALSTDITPTLYALAGHIPADLGTLYGRPLFVPRDASHRPAPREPLLIASSYGAVYGVLTNNGTHLYIADGVNNRDYAYDISGPLPIRIGVTAQERHDHQAFIRTQVDEIARLYRFVPRS